MGRAAAGDRLPERVAGSSLIWPIAERAAREGRALYLLGGEASVNARAAEVLKERWPALRIAGASSPMIGSPPSADELAGIAAEVRGRGPTSCSSPWARPSRSRSIRALRAALPACWMIGVGASFGFVAGTLRRAPRWVQRIGLEWCWRLVQEPRRLVRRYLIEDLPFSGEVFARSLARRFR